MEKLYLPPSLFVLKVACCRLQNAIYPTLIYLQKYTQDLFLMEFFVTPYVHKAYT